MTETGSVPYHRYKVRTKPEQSETVMQYLHRSTLFWNFICQHLKDDVQTYLKETDTEESSLRFSDALYALFEKVVNGSDLSEDLEISDAWKSYIPKIRELPRNLLTNRFVDMANAYRLAKQNLLERSERPTGIPKRKNNHSSQSIRFSPTDFKVEKGRILIDSVYPLTLEVDGINPSDFERKNYYLSITKRPAPKSISEYGPEDPLDPVYVVTLKKENQ